MKVALRRKIRAEVASRSPLELARASEAICDSVRALAEWREAKTVGLFAPQSFEPFIDALLEDAIADGKRVLYPKVLGTVLGLGEVRSIAELVEGPWRLREPVQADHQHGLDLLLVPGTAFTKSGARLGRGGGYYDRLLEKCDAAATAGICFACQLVETLPAEAHDRDVELVVTENGVYRSRGN